MTSFSAKIVTLKIVYNKKKIQTFGMNMSFISSREARKCIFHSWRNLFHLVRRENVYFIRGFGTHEICIFASLDEINGIFIPKI